MSWLDDLFARQMTALQDAVVKTVRSKWNFIGATVVDNPSHGWLDITVGAPTEAELELPLVIAGNQVWRPTGDGSETLDLPLATSGHVENATLLILVAGGEFGAINPAPNLNLSEAEAAEFDPAEDCVISILAFEIDGVIKFKTTLSVIEHDLAAPTISSKTVATASNPNALVVVFSESVHLPDLTGLSLNFTVGTPRTITAIEAGNNTATVTLTLSGNCTSGDAATLVIGSDRTLQDMNGNLIATSTSAVTFT